MHILTAEPETASVIAGSWIGDKQVGGDTSFAVRNPYSGDVVATVSHPTPEQVETALDQAWAARAVLASLPAYRRSDALRHVATRMLERRDEFATTITWESGKPIRWAHAEVERASATFRWAAEEALRWSGELQRLDSDPSAEGRLALVRRVPRGPVLGITPFNFPLNLVAHKVAPALAVGAPIVLKPAPKTPLSALLLGELLAECDLPAGAFAVLTVTNDAAPALVTDRRLPVVSFTGSVPVGWSIRDTVPRKHVALELGGNAAVLVCADWGGEEDLAAAAHRVALCANYQGGQSCISVQRVFVDRTLYPRFVDLLVDAVGDLAVGDPWADETEVGPLIDETAAQRVESWVAEAVRGGARLLAGGTRSGSVVQPAVLADVPADSPIVCDEVFGPVLVVEPVDGVDDGLRRVDDSRFGLQAGVFTRDIAVAFRAHRELEVGGVIVGDVPTFRAEQMPYGGVKESGIGREGVRSAMEDYTEPRVMVLSGVSL